MTFHIVDAIDVVSLEGIVVSGVDAVAVGDVVAFGDVFCCSWLTVVARFTINFKV